MFDITTLLDFQKFRFFHTHFLLSQEKVFSSICSLHVFPLMVPTITRIKYDWHQSLRSISSNYTKNIWHFIFLLSTWDASHNFPHLLLSTFARTFARKDWPYIIRILFLANTRNKILRQLLEPRNWALIKFYNTRFYRNSCLSTQYNMYVCLCVCVLRKMSIPAPKRWDYRFC